MADMSAPPASSAAATAAASSAAFLLPSGPAMQQAAKLAIEQDRAIMMDYYHPSAQGTAYLGEDPETKERVLVKSKEEFTSLIGKLFKVGEDYIVMTENSLYIISGKIKKRPVNLASLQEAYDNE